MKESSSRFIKKAHDFRKNHDYLQAGEYYSIAGHAYLAESWDLIRAKDVGFLRKGGLLKAYVWQEYAATCYKLSEAQSRAENRAKQGILGLEDVRNNMIEHPAWIGLSWELEGDLQVIANLSGVDEAYETALTYFREVELSCNESEILSWCTEPGFNETSLYVTELAVGVGIDLELSDLRLKDEQPSLIKRLEYKRERLSTLLEQLEDQGEWRWENHSLPTIENRVDEGNDSVSEDSI